MGRFFQPGGLTQQGSALVDQGGNAAMVGSPSQMRNTLLQSSANFKPFANSDMTTGAPTPAQSPLHTVGIGTPSFLQAATAGAMPAGASALSPGLSKAGKLATLLTSGLQGALAGQRASEQAVIQSGGRRAGGAGMGFEAGYMLPWQRAGAQAELAQRQAQTGLLQAEQQNINVPGVGPMPAWLARTMGPAWLRMQGQEQAAQTGAQSRQAVAQTAAGARIGAAQIGQRFKVVPNVGLFDTQANGGQGAIVPGTQQGIVITPEIAADYQLPPAYVGKPMNLQNLAAVQRSSVFQNVPEMTAEGPIIVNRRTAAAVPVTGPGGQRYGPTGLAMPREVGDIANPGQTVLVPAGQAFGRPGIASASVQVPRAAARAEVPTQIGNQKVAFNTAMQHADLLQSALTALNNGDTRTLNSLKNRLKTEFGSPDITNFQTISNAYTREITKMLSAGHVTDAEIAQQGATIPANASPAQILGALRSYKNLAQSKLNMLNQQKNAAISGAQPARRGGNQAANDPLGLR